MRYAIVIAKGPVSYGAYVPDLPGCVAAADTREEAARLIGEAALLRLEDLRGRGEAIPEPASSFQYVDGAA